MANIVPALPLENVQGVFVEGSGILKIQQFLKSRGYDPTYLDGKYGPLTAAALQRWMQDNLLYDKERGPNIGIPYAGCVTLLMLGIPVDRISFVEMKRAGYIQDTAAPDIYSCGGSEKPVGQPWYTNPYIWLAVGGGLLVGTILYTTVKRR